MSEAPVPSWGSLPSLCRFCGCLCARLCARAIADQLGHSRVSMTQDVYLVRKAKNAGNLDALEALNPDGPNYKNEEGEETAGEEGAA